jgi:hypothetical protein
LSKRRVRFTATAQSHVQREKVWWLQHRDYPDVFAEELEQAVEIVAVLPGAGTVYAPSPVTGVRRLYLRRVDLHLYYTFDPDEVVIRALWGARRGHGPNLNPWLSAQHRRYKPIGTWAQSTSRPQPATVRATRGAFTSSSTGPSPVVRRPARFHDDLAPRGKLLDESLEPPPGQSLPFDDPPGSIREGRSARDKEFRTSAIGCSNGIERLSTGWSRRLSSPIVYLTADQILDLHRIALMLGAVEGLRSEHDLLSAVFQPQQTVLPFGDILTRSTPACWCSRQASEDLPR